MPITIQEAYADKEEMGTITLKTNRLDLNAFQVYSIYKQRQAIEQFFKTYGDTMSYEASYMRNNYTEEAWLFLNHLSTIIGANAIEEITPERNSCAFRRSFFKEVSKMNPIRTNRTKKLTTFYLRCFSPLQS